MSYVKELYAVTQQCNWIILDKFITSRFITKKMFISFFFFLRRVKQNHSKWEDKAYNTD